MCPFCLATAAMIAGSIAGTGGLAAVVTGAIVSRRHAQQISSESADKESRHDDSSTSRSEAA